MISQLEVTSARSLAEAYAVLEKRPAGLKVLAGGTDLMVAINARAGVDSLGHVLDIWKVKELRGITATPGLLSIGALTTYSDLLKSEEVRARMPALALVSREVGAWAIQNRGTIGGNVCNASPAGDTLPVLIAADARFVLGGPRGERTVAADAFFVGYRKTQLARDELLLRVEIPTPEGLKLVYRKVGTRKAQSISKVILAARALPGLKDVRVAAGCVAPIPLRCCKAEAAIESGGDFKEALQQDIAPIDDVRSTAIYRRKVASNVLAQLVQRLS